jgi:uncharacterized protein (TIGR02099 family)
MLKTPLLIGWRGLSHLTRIVLLGTMLLTLICGSVMLGIRYWVLPDIERYHGVITSAVSDAIGLPVFIGKIEADWQGLRPHLLLSDVRISEKNKSATPVLSLRQVDCVVAWFTLLRGDLRLFSIELDQPEVVVRRDAHGKLHIVGVTLNDQASTSGGMEDWLLHQTFLLVRNGKVTWLDEQLNTPPLVLNKINLLIENHLRHHRFAMNAMPPANLSAKIELQGDFSGRSFSDLKGWAGRLYTRIDYADLSAWRQWLPLPEGISSGRGALRGWVEIGDGKVKQLTADGALADVHAQLGEGLKPLELRTMRGNLDWKGSASGTEFALRLLSLETDEVKLAPIDFALKMSRAAGKKPASGELSANTLDLGELVNLADALPLSQNLRARLVEFAPGGTVSGLHAKWQGEIDQPEHFEVKAKFDELSLRRTAKLPGFSGVSGDLEGSDVSGSLSLNSKNLKLDAPLIMPEPLAFESISGQGHWQIGSQGAEIKFSNVVATNADLAGTVDGRFETLANSPGVIDLSIHLTRAAIRHADRYIPLDALDEETHDWLHSALLEGQTDDFNLQLHGDLNDFPFKDGKKGIFKIQSHFHGGALVYDNEWPRIDNITGELRILGKRLEVIAPSGSTAGVHLQNVSVLLADMVSPDLLLQIRGESDGETSRGLHFIQRSPVHVFIDGFTDTMKARGNGLLKLAVDVPLSGNKPVVVSGSYHLIDNEVDIGEGVPVLYSANGDILFTESSINTRNLKAQILGGPATLEVQSGEDGSIQAKVRGKLNMDWLRKNITHPLLNHFHGGSEWQTDITVQKKLTDVLITSNLTGLESDLPKPFGKKSGDSVPLRFELNSLMPKQDLISFKYGGLLSARILRREEGGDMIVKRGTLNFGGIAKWQKRDGLWITGTLPQVSIEDWSDVLLLPENKTSGGTPPPTIAGADLIIQKLDAYGHSVNGLHILAQNVDNVISAQLASKEINGGVSWQSVGKGKLVARLKNLTLGKEDNLAVTEGGGGETEQTTPQSTVDNLSSNWLPELDLAVDELTWKDKKLGKLELLAHQRGRDWELESMHLTNPDGMLSAEGMYHKVNGKMQTNANLKLGISNAGKMLARFGFPDTVKNGNGKLNADFAWFGTPDDFSFATLNGKLSLETGKGQFLKINPGAGKLLGILSLQALPKHISLDFSDVFSDGFAFDNITGTAVIKRGVMDTQNFRIDGSAANVTMTGQVDLNQETQNLKVRILPTVGNSVSLIGAFAAGPAIGVGAFIVNKILRDPLDKLVSFDYNVTGTWDNPSVNRNGPVANDQSGKESNP